MSGWISYFIQSKISSVYFTIEMSDIVGDLIFILPIVICGMTLLIIQPEITKISKTTGY